MKKSNHFQRAKARLCIHHPFFGVPALHLIEVEDERVPTVATDGTYIRVNPEWIKTVGDKERIGLLAHEVLHCCFGHIFPWRRGMRNPTLWNIAGDFVINLLVLNDGLVLPKGGLIDEQYADKCSEEVYSILYEQCEKESGESGQDDGEGQGDGEEQDEGQGGGQGGGQGEGKKSLNAGHKLPWEDVQEPSEVKKGDGASDSGENADGDSSNADGDSDGDDGNPFENLSNEEKRELERIWKERLASAVASARMRGKLPAGAESLIEEYLNPRLPWEHLLEAFISEATQDDYSWRHCDRRFVSQNLYLPGLHDNSAKGVVVIDTSGSVSDQQVASFLGELWGICSSNNVKEIRYIQCDAAVQYDEILTPYDDIPKAVVGRGGTRFEPPFELLEEENAKPDFLVYFTDMQGSFPEEAPSFPTLWVSNSDIEDAPFGRVLSYSDLD